MRIKGVHLGRRKINLSTVYRHHLFPSSQEILKMFKKGLLLYLATAAIALAAPTNTTSSTLTASASSSAPPEFETVPPATSFLNNQPYAQGTNDTPEAFNDGFGATILAPDDTVIDQQNPDFLAPPTTDNNLM